MINCQLSKILGEKRIKVAALARETGINKNTLHRLFNDEATRIELDVLDKLCEYLDVEIGEMLVRE